MCIECTLACNCYKAYSDDCYYCENCGLYEPINVDDEDEKEVK